MASREASGMAAESSDSLRAKAEEARARANGMRDLAARNIMLDVANAYEQLAVHTKKREAMRAARPPR